MNYQPYTHDNQLEGRDPISCMTIESQSEVNGKSQSQGIMILSESIQNNPPPSILPRLEVRVQNLTSLDEIASQPDVILVEEPAAVQQGSRRSLRRAEWKLANKSANKEKVQEANNSHTNTQGYRLIKQNINEQQKQQEQQLQPQMNNRQKEPQNYKHPNYNDEKNVTTAEKKNSTKHEASTQKIPSQPLKMAKYREFSKTPTIKNKMPSTLQTDRPNSRQKIISSELLSQEIISEGSLSDISSKKEGGRERKHNSFFHNADFITNGDLSSNLRTKKRPNPVESIPQPQKKMQKNPKSNERIPDLKAQIKNLFDPENLKKAKKCFIASFCPPVHEKPTTQVLPTAFSFKNFPKGISSQQSQSILHEKVAFFQSNPNQQFIEDTFEEDIIFLVDNNNQNVEIKVKRTPLDKGVLTKKNLVGNDPLAHIVNRFDEKSRSKFFSGINFIKDYKTGYAPIEIQQQQEKELDEMKIGEEEDQVTHKQHFIRRKQAQNISLKRSCGVSYVKQPESKQENVGDIYERLPQLVFQCSNGQPKMLEHESFYAKLYDKLFNASWLVCTYFESEDETLMRDYLLYPDQRWSLCKGKYFIMKSVNAIWPLFIERQFLCIHFVFDHKELIRCPQLKDFSIEEVQNIVKHSNIHIGLLFKKSINGKKAFKKSLGEAFMGEMANHPSSQSAATKEKKMKKLAAKLIEAAACSTSGVDCQNQEGKQSQMSKTEVNRIFKLVKNQLKQDTFLKELPIFKKRIQSIQEDFLSFSKILQPGTSVIPSEEIIKNIEILETNQERIEALLELMQHIQEAVKEAGPPAQASSSTKKESAKIIEEFLPTSTPTKQMDIEEQSTFANAQEISNLIDNNATQIVQEGQEVQQQQLSDEPSRIEIEEPQSNENKSIVRAQTTADYSGDSSCLSPLKQTISPQVEINLNELNQNAQTFHEVESKQIQGLCSPLNCSSPEGTQVSKNNENSALDSQVTISSSTQPLKNKGADQEESTTSIVKSSLQQIIPKESLICQEVLDYIDRDLSSKNINTLSAKLEMYVEENGWKGSTGLVKSLLSTFILYVKDQFEKLALNMMNTRFAVVRENDETRISQCLENIRFVNKHSSKRRPIFENLSAAKNKKWDFPQAVSESIFNNQRQEYNLEKLILETTQVTMGKLLDKEDNYSVLKKGEFNMPLYYISTRDSFAFDLIEKISTCRFSGKEFTKTEYFFDPANHPSNFKSFVSSFPDYRVGTTLYTGFFSHQELKSIEDSCYETEVKSFQRHYFPMTAQMTCTAQKIRRTKFFFGSRYIWTRQQLSEPHSFVGAGVRQDVSKPPAWMRAKVVRPLEKAGILPDGYINSLALNVYHDGKEGLAQHFDDATRFMQLFSDARLSFGSQLYGFCNSAFVIPMPRGSILKLEENSYAANGIKHCVRPCDMSGKNATIIMRQMHHKNEANVYDQHVDLPTWISTASCKPESLPYGDQKTIEADYLMRNGPNACS